MQKPIIRKFSTLLLGEALLTKNLISSESKTIRAITECKWGMGRRLSIFKEITICLIFHTMGPFSPSWIPKHTHGSPRSYCLSWSTSLSATSSTIGCMNSSFHRQVDQNYCRVGKSVPTSIAIGSKSWPEIRPMVLYHQSVLDFAYPCVRSNPFQCWKVTIWFWLPLTYLGHPCHVLACPKVNGGQKIRRLLEFRQDPHKTVVLQTYPKLSSIALNDCFW